MPPSSNSPSATIFAVMVAFVVVAHFAFIGYLVGGGFLGWRWPRTLWLHGCAVAWGVSSVALGLPCPLTALERWGRREAGLSALPPEGFVAHYLTGVFYPAGFAAGAQLVVFATVLASWSVPVAGGFMTRRCRQARSGRLVAMARPRPR